jgi:predicted nucleotidyltransferase
MIITLWVIPITALVAATMHLMNRWRQLTPRDLGNRAPHRALALAETDAGPELQPTRLRRTGSVERSSRGECDPIETSNAVDLSGPIENLLPQGNLEQLCREARVGKLSVFPTIPGPRSQRGESPKVLVEFERGAIVDYPAFLRLQHRLSALVGRPVDLYAKGKSTPNALGKPHLPARVLYTAPS